MTCAKALCALMILASADQAAAATIGLTVQGTDSVYDYASASAAGSGATRPLEIVLPPGTHRTLTFTKVTGKVTLTPGNGGYGPHGPDGSPNAFNLSVAPAAGLSGITSSNVGYLAGVFLDGGEGDGHAPASLDFRPSRLGEHFASLSPLTDQVFFIGDGRVRTGAGLVQTFVVPDGATLLALGIVDAYGYAGAPGAYFDNSGAFNISLAVKGGTGECCRILGRAR
jgi:hypothetical protein